MLSVERYTIGGIWSPMDTEMVQGRVDCRVELIDSNLFVLGGGTAESGGGTDSVEVFNISTGPSVHDSVAYNSSLCDG